MPRLSGAELVQLLERAMEEEADEAVGKRRVAPPRFAGERAKRLILQTTRLTARFLQRQGQEAAKRLAESYGRLAPPPRKD